MENKAFDDSAETSFADRMVRLEAWEELMESVQDFTAIQVVDVPQYEPEKNIIDNAKMSLDSITNVVNIAVISTALIIEHIKNYKKM